MSHDDWPALVVVVVLVLVARSSIKGDLKRSVRRISKDVLRGRARLIGVGVQYYKAHHFV